MRFGPCFGQSFGKSYSFSFKKWIIFLEPKSLLFVNLLDLFTWTLLVQGLIFCQPKTLFSRVKKTNPPFLRCSVLKKSFLYSKKLNTCVSHVLHYLKVKKQLQTGEKKKLHQQIGFQKNDQFFE